MTSVRTLFPVLIVTVAVLSACTAGERTFEKKFSVSPGGELSLKTDVGSVKVTGTSANEVSIVATIHGRDRVVEGFEITAEQSGNGVQVYGRAKEHGSWFFNTGNDLDVEYVVKVPKSYNIRMETAGGNIAITSITGTVHAETSGGDAEAVSVEGAVDLGTSGGNVKAERVTGQVRVETSGGEITVREIKGDVDASTSGGNVRVGDVEGRVRAETSGGNVSVKVRGTNKGIHAETSGGNIEVVIPKGVGATVDAATSGGDVVCDLPITVSGRISEDRIQGTVGGGGATVYAHTSGGDVRIRGEE